MSEDFLSPLPKGLTLCQNLVKADDYQDSIDFFVENTIHSLKDANSYGNAYFSIILQQTMEIIMPRYTASQDEEGIIVRKYFQPSSMYKSMSPVECYQAFEKAVIDQGLASADYFRNYEQANLAKIQNFLANNNVTSFEQEEGDFCLSLTVECIGGECIRYDAMTMDGHPEL